MFPSRLKKLVQRASISILPIAFLLISLLTTITLLLPNVLLAADEETLPSGIHSPVAGSVITGTVVISGTALHPNFAKYEVHYKRVEHGDDGYIYFAGATYEVADDQLALWEAGGLLPGIYMLRLRVVQENGNYAEYSVSDLLVPEQEVHGQPIAPTATVVATAVATAQESGQDGEESAVETATPDAVTVEMPSVPISIALSGESDVESLNGYLRYLLSENVALGSSITATIGALPADLAINLQIPRGSTVVGTLTIGGAQVLGSQTVTRLYLATEQDPEQLLSTLRAQLLAQGLTPPTHFLTEEQKAMMKTVPLNAPSLFCDEDGEFGVILNSAQTGNATSQGVLVTIQEIGAPSTLCQSSPFPEIEKLGQMGMPKSGIGGGLMTSYFADGSFDIFEVRSEFTGVTSGLADLQEYYGTQLIDMGWSLVAEEALTTLARSTWALNTEKSEWRLTVDFIVDPTQANSYLLTMWAKRTDAIADDVMDPGVAYYYTKSEAAFLRMTTFEGKSFTSLVPQEREFWIGVDGSGRIRQQYGMPSFFTEEERAAWEEMGRPGINELMDMSFGPGEAPTYSDIPDDLSALAQEVREIAEITENPLPWEMFTVVGRLLREMPHRLETRQALFQVGSEIEGVEVVEQLEDRLGRPAIALSFDGTFNETTTRKILFFNPENYALLGEEEVLLAPTESFSAKAGETIGWVTYLVSGSVDSTERGLDAE